MPFGAGTFECPAKKFGPLLIGIMVAALLSVEDGHFVMAGDGVEKKVSDGPLENGRKACEGLKLRLAGKTS
jgi:hypothetical protein